MKILVADDHRLIREGLKPFLRRLDRHLRFVEAWDAASVWEAAHANLDLDLALIDLNMPGMKGTSSIASLRDAFPSLPLIVVSGIEDPTDVEEVLRSGASGYIPKTASADVMVQAIRLVLAGGCYLPPTILLPRSDPIGSGPASTPAEDCIDTPARARLSPRQKQVIDLLSEGLPNKVIAQRLGLTVGTVKSHMVQIFHLLGVRNRTEAVLAAKGLRQKQRLSGRR